jgi:hypothetical protein
MDEITVRQKGAGLRKMHKSDGKKEINLSASRFISI